MVVSWFCKLSSPVACRILLNNVITKRPPEFQDAQWLQPV